MFYLFIFSIFFAASLSGLDVTDLESEISLYSGQVNLFTGEYSEASSDLALKGPYPLTLERVFTDRSLMGKQEILSWQFNHPGIIRPEEIPLSHLHEGTKIKYTADSDGLLSSIKVMDTNETKTFHEAHLTRSKDGFLIIKADDGREIKYRLSTLDPSRTKENVLIDEVYFPDQRFIKYKYRKHPLERKYLISKIETPGGGAIETEYYDNKYNNVGGDLVIIENPLTDFRIGRVKQQKAMTGKDGGAQIFQTFFYEKEKTTVKDALGNKKIIEFTENGLIQSIAWWEPKPQGEKCIKKIRIYRSDSKPDQVASYTLEDGQGRVFLCITFLYDRSGNRVQETLHGNLSGLQKEPMIIKNGLPSNSYEKSTRTYRYSAPDEHSRTRILEKVDERGLITKYSYTPDAKLSSVILCKGSKIFIRRFFSYDGHGLLIEAITDDGQGIDKEDFAGITERKITSYKRRSSKPCMGMIEEETETAFDLENETEFFVKKIKYDYDYFGNIILQETINESGLVLTQKTCAYDLFGRVLSSHDQEGIKFFQYSQDGKLEEETVYANEQEPLINKYIYDKANRLIGLKSEKEGVDKTKSYTYNALNQKMTEIDNCGNETFYEYDGQSRLIAISHPVVPTSVGQMLRPREEFKFDLFGNKTHSKDPSGYETVTSYNMRGKPTEIIHPDGSTEKFIYSAEGSAIQTTDRLGIITFYQYDELGRVSNKEMISSEGKIISQMSCSYSSFRLKKVNERDKESCYLYDGAGRLQSVSIMSPYRSKSIHYSYDASGHVIQKSEQSEGNLLTRTITKRDLFGKPISEHVEDKQGHILRYENFSEKEVSKIPQNSFETSMINYKGCKEQRKIQVDKFGIVTEQVQDALGRTLYQSKKNSFGDILEQIIFSYDLSGNKTSESHGIFIDGIRTDTFTITWSYGPQNRIEEITELSEKQSIRKTRYLYNERGLLKTVIKPNGISIETTYNDLGKVSRIQSSDNSVDYTFEYDSSGHIVTANDLSKGISTLREYNPEGHLVREVLGNGLVLSSLYDATGKRIELTLPDSSGIRYEYDAINLLALSRLDPFGKILYTHEYSSYNSQGALLEEILPGDLGMRTRIYDKRILTGIKTPYFSDEFILLDELTSYPQKREIIDDEGLHEIDYRYNYRGELIAEDQQGMEYAYDSFGNRISENNESFHYENGHLLTVAKGISYFYDLCGNLVKKIDPQGNATQFEYDALDRLVKVIKNDELAGEYLYDPFYRRIEKRTLDSHTKYIWDGQFEIGSTGDDNLINELKVLGNSQNSEIGKALAIEIKGKTYIPLHDLTGSVRCLISLDDKTTLERYHYNAFGEVDTALYPLSPWRFCGKRVDDETGLIYFGRRYYDPDACRWTTLDPLGYQDGPNRFLFVLNNPIINSDPCGLFITSLWNGLTGLHAMKESFAENLREVAGFDKHLGSELTTIFEAALGKELLGVAGYYSDGIESGTYGQGEPASNVRITLINGILNLRKHFCESMELILRTHGGSNIHYIFRPTEGWCWDLINGFMIKCGFISSYAEKLAETWKKLIQEMGGVDKGGLIIHYCHSLGGSDTATARSLLTEEESKMIRVFSFGSATMIPSTLGFEHVTNFISMRDGITLFDPVGLVKALIYEDSNVVFAGSFYGTPLIDHMLGSETYVEILRRLGLMYMRICNDCTLHH